MNLGQKVRQLSELQSKVEQKAQALRASGSSVLMHEQVIHYPERHPSDKPYCNSPSRYSM